MLDYEGDDLEEALYQAFTVEQEVFGAKKCHELVEDGASIFVNQENKHEFVQLVVEFWLNEYCEKQFEAFERGFKKTVRPQVLELLRPDELKQLVCGSQVLDFQELEQSAKYVDGYTEHAEIATWLWEIVNNELTLDE